MRRSEVPAEVETGAHRPTTLTIEGTTWTIRRVLDDWRVGGRWWLGETPRTHYRVELRDGRVLDLVEDAEGWHVARESD